MRVSMLKMKTISKFKLFSGFSNWSSQLGFYKPVPLLENGLLVDYSMCWVSHTCRFMIQIYGGFHFVHILAPGPSRSGRFYFVVFGVQLNVHIVNFWHDCYCGCAGMNPTLRFCCRNSLNPMNPTLILQLTVDTVTTHLCIKAIIGDYSLD